jgi:hypothetical protein
MTFDEWYDGAIWGNEDFRAGCRRAWDAALAAAWVPCAERMPEERRVLTWNGRCVETVWYDPETTADTWSDEGVTHWMPLPAPPKEPAQDHPGG